MKQLILYSCMVVGLLMAACSGEPVFPDPGLDSTRSVRDTVRRDTIDVYYLEMHVKAPNGVHSIQILDGMTYKELDRLEQYKGKTDFTLSYPIDLKGVSDEDKVMNFIVKVIDNDMRSYNKGFTLLVKRFSQPTITFLGGVQGTLGLVSPVFELKAFFETGLNKIQNYKVLFEGNIIDQGVVEGGLSEYHYSHVCNLPMEKGEKYQLVIELTDDQGTMKSRVLELSLIEVTKPIQAFIYSVNSSGTRSLTRVWDFVYNKEEGDRLERVDGMLYTTVSVSGISTERLRPFTYDFFYTDFGLVKGMKEKALAANMVTYEEKEWIYTYDDLHRLTSAVDAEQLKTDILCGDWYEDNRVKGYAYRPDYPTLTSAIYQTTATGESVFAESWVVSGQRGICTKMSPVSISSYMPQLPPFTPYPAGPKYEDMQVLLMWKYGCEQIHAYDAKKGSDFANYASTNPRLEYSFVTNSGGRLEKIIKRTVSLSTGARSVAREYQLIYE